MKPPRFGVFAVVWAPLFVLARQSRFFEVVAFTFMFTTLFLVGVESIRPKVQVRKKPLPKPEIRLNLNG